MIRQARRLEATLRSGTPVPPQRRAGMESVALSLRRALANGTAARLARLPQIHCSPRVCRCGTVSPSSSRVGAGGLRQPLTAPMMRFSETGERRCTAWEWCLASLRFPRRGSDVARMSQRIRQPDKWLFGIFYCCDLHFIFLDHRKVNHRRFFDTDHLPGSDGCRQSQSQSSSEKASARS